MAKNVHNNSNGVLLVITVENLLVNGVPTRYIYSEAHFPRLFYSAKEAIDFGKEIYGENPSNISLSVLSLG